MGIASLFIGPATIMLEVDAPDTRGELAMASVFVGLGALFMGLALVRMFTAAQGRSLLRRWRDLGIGLVLVVGPGAVIAGVAPWATVAGVWIFPVLAFLFDRRYFLSRPRQAEEEDNSLLQTQFLDVTLDPITDVLDGEVTQGQFQGRVLSDLSPDELDALMDEVSSDPDSVSILTSIFMQFRESAQNGQDHRAESGARQGRQQRSGAGGRRGDDRQRVGGVMEAEEAYKVLGLQPGVSEDEILATHRRLMKMVHPDRGGSDYLASKVNEARDLLLGL